MDRCNVIVSTDSFGDLINKGTDFLGNFRAASQSGRHYLGHQGSQESQADVIHYCQAVRLRHY
jgi:hypothetical protein